MLQKIYNGLKHSQDKPKAEGTSTSNNSKKLRRSMKGGKQ